MLLADLASDVIHLDRGMRRLEITGVTADSREVRPGYLFAALPGTKVDGSAYIEAAVAAGAAAVLVGEGSVVPEGLSIPVLSDGDVRRRFAKVAARMYAPQPETIVAVTGTNGKTSVAAFTRQIWQAAGREAASVGTIGVVTSKGETYGNLTTPDPVSLHRTLAELAQAGVGSVALEASSHGLVQRRLDGLRITAGAYTNISRDHLDYHGSFESYLSAKMRLFDTVLDPGASAVVNLDDAHGETVAAGARINGLEVITVGTRGSGIRLVSVEREGFAQRVTVDAGRGPRTVLLPLVGAFQVSNALVAAGLAIATGVDADVAIEALAGLQGAKGRLELVAYAPSGAPVFVDYSHTPAALETALETLRPYVTNRLSVVFGAGGDRDRGKRPQMGEAAERLADSIIVTDDNPRTENAADIRAAVLAGTPSAVEIPGRADAIRHAVAALEPGDVLLVAGKGHETGQIVGTEVLPFSDHEEVLKALPGADGAAPGLWRADELVAAIEGRVLGTIGQVIDDVSIDSRSVTPGDVFFAIKGDRFDGHDFVVAALKNGAAVAVVSEERLASLPETSRPLIVVQDVLEALRKLGAAARTRSKAAIIAVTGSVGKTSTKEALRQALAASGQTHASAASFNNHWGVPLTLAKLPREAVYAVFEIGMNHAGEITPLVQLVRPHVALITTVARVHIEHFGSEEGIALAKAEILDGVEPGGAAVLNRDNPWYDLLADEARRRGVLVASFGENKAADSRLLKLALKSDCSCVSASVLGQDVTYKVGAAGRHLVDNSLAVLAAVRLVGADLAKAVIALGRVSQPKGRGRRHRLDLRSGSATLIDESYNANPLSMQAAIALTGQAEVRGSGRRIAVLGDMLELGPDGPADHAALAGPIAAAGIQRVYCAGPLMRNLWQALPREVRGAYSETSSGLETILLDEVAAGDVMMIKGSFGSRMGPLVDALLDRYGAENAAAA
jgi:UDP-N-acetylmuramyl-tripeptide synthetase/UDP-N-acetylmuramoyl-tripeptide--D-alanyl-D-alanine ligase